MDPDPSRTERPLLDNIRDLHVRRLEEGALLGPLAAVAQELYQLPTETRAKLAESGLVPPELEASIMASLAARANQQPVVGAAQRIPGGGLDVFYEIMRLAGHVEHAFTPQPSLARRVTKYVPYRRPERGNMPGPTPTFIDPTELATSSMARVVSPRHAQDPAIAALASRAPAPSDGASAHDIHSAILATIYNAEVEVLEELRAGNFFHIELPLLAYFRSMNSEQPIRDAFGIPITAGHGLSIVGTIVESAGRVLRALQGLPVTGSHPVVPHFSHAPEGPSTKLEDAITERFEILAEPIAVHTPGPNGTVIITLYEQRPDGTLRPLGSYRKDQP